MLINLWRLGLLGIIYHSNWVVYSCWLRLYCRRLIYKTLMINGSVSLFLILVFCHYCLCYCFNLCICIYIVDWVIVTPFKSFIIVAILILYAVSFLSDILLNVVHIFVTSNQLGVLSTCGYNCRLRMLAGIQSLVAKIWKCV